MKESILERNKRIGADEKRAAFIAKQKLPYEIKKNYAAIRAREFVGLCDQHGKNYHVSVGGLDSITLFLFLHSIGIRCPGVSASYLEDKGNQAVHRALGIVSVSPLKRADGKPWTKSAVIQEFGFPVLSKEIAAKIELLQNPSEKNVTVRHAIITGETGAYGGNRKNTRMQLSQKWLRKFGDYEIDTIIPKAYGTIAKDSEGRLYTTMAQRTGCSMCGFGIHLEKRPNRFDLLYQSNRKEWKYLMFRCCKDESGNFFGWSRVLDYIGVGWMPEEIGEENGKNN